MSLNDQMLDANPTQRHVNDERIAAPNPSFAPPYRGETRIDQLKTLDNIPNILRDLTQEDVAKHFDVTFGDIMRLREAGQKEYAHGPSFGNFNRLAIELDLPRGKVLWTYLAKHLDGIKSFLKGHRSQRESVHGRIQDAIVYLLLLDAMIMEDEYNGVNRTTSG